MKKILTLLALMVATVAVVATGYKLTRPAKAAGDVTSYSQTMTGLGGWMFGTGDPIKTENVALNVTDNGNGTYDFVFNNLELNTSSMGLMNFNTVSFPGVTGKEENGYIVYSGSSNNMTVEGKSKDGVMYVQFKGSFYYMSDVTLTYGTPFPEEPDPGTGGSGSGSEIEGTVVGTDNYTPLGTDYAWDATIDWNTQKLVACLDVSDCYKTNENILSFGNPINDWAGVAIHFYYTRGTNGGSLEIDYLPEAGSGSNTVRKQLTVEGDELLFEFSKEHGATVNGIDFNYKNGASSTFTDYSTVYANLFALTNIKVGSQQGDTRSLAKSKYVRIQNLASTPETKDPVVYTDNAKSVYGGTTTDQTDQTVEITETGENLYKVVYKGLTLGNNALGDFTAENVPGTLDADGYVNYEFDGKAILTNANEILAMYGMLTEGGEMTFKMTGKSKDGKLAAKFTTALQGNEGIVYFGDYKIPATTVAYTDVAKCAYNGTTTEQADQTVEITETGENLYKVVFKSLTLGTTQVADFTAENVSGTLDADGYVNYTFDGEATLTSVSSMMTTFYGINEGSTAPFTITGKSKDGKLAAKFTTKISDYDATLYFGDYTEPVEPVKPVTYTDQLVLAGAYSGTLENATLNVTDNGDGTYKLEWPKLDVPGIGLIGTVVCPSVPGTVNEEDGAVTFNASETEFDVEGMDAAKTSVEGKLLDGKAYLKLNCELFYESNTFTFGTPFPNPAVKYTDTFVYTISDYATTVENYTASVTDNGDGTYKIELPAFGSYSATFNAVPGTVQEDGSVVYAAENVEGSLSDGMNYKFNINGKSTAEKLYLNCAGQINEFDGTNSLVFGTPFPEVVPGTVVGEDGYEANNTAFTWNATIDWNTQKLVASIDLTNCKNTNENILSVGQSISEWASAPHIHFYYTASSKSLQFNVMTPDNKSRWDITVDPKQPLEIEISKQKGLVINGTQYLNLYNSASQYESLDAYLEATAAIWELTDIEVGGCQGETMSNAKYNYVRIQPLPTEEPKIVETETFTDAMKVIDPDNTENTITNKTLDINKYSDETYGVTLHNVEGATNDLGDLVLKGLTVTNDEETGYTYYGGDDLKATINSETSSLNGKEVTVSLAGVRYSDTKAWFQLEVVCGEEVYEVEFGSEKNTYAEGTAYKGRWSVAHPAADFDGVVDLIEQEDGKYAFRVHDFQIDGQVVPTFVIPNIDASEADGKMMFSNYTKIPVVYESNSSVSPLAEGVSVTYVEMFMATLENGKLIIAPSYIGYGDGSNDYVTSPRFESTIETGINGINAAALNGKANIYTTTGAKVNAMQKGVNIVRMNGKATKIVKK